MKIAVRSESGGFFGPLPAKLLNGCSFIRTSQRTGESRGEHPMVVRIPNDDPARLARVHDARWLKFGVRPLLPDFFSLLRDRLAAVVDLFHSCKCILKRKSSLLCTSMRKCSRRDHDTLLLQFQCVVSLLKKVLERLKRLTGRQGHALEPSHCTAQIQRTARGGGKAGSVFTQCYCASKSFLLQPFLTQKWLTAIQEAPYKRVCADQRPLTGYWHPKSLLCNQQILQAAIDPDDKVCGYTNSNFLSDEVIM